MLFRYASDFRWPLRLASALASCQLGILATSWYNLALIPPPLTPEEAAAAAAVSGDGGGADAAAAAAATAVAAATAAAGVVMPTMYFNFVAGSTLIASGLVVAAVPLFASRLLCSLTVSLVPRGRSHVVPIARIATHSMLGFGPTREVSSLGIRVLETGHARYSAVELMDGEHDHHFMTIMTHLYTNLSAIVFANVCSLPSSGFDEDHALHARQDGRAFRGRGGCAHCRCRSSNDDAARST